MMFWKRKKLPPNFTSSDNYQFPKPKISVTIGDYDPEVKIQRCRNFLESATLEVLFQERERASNFIESRYQEVTYGVRERLFLRDFVFPGSKDSKTGYEIDAFDYSFIAEKIIREKSEREKVQAS